MSQVKNFVANAINQFDGLRFIQTGTIERRGEFVFGRNGNDLMIYYRPWASAQKALSVILGDEVRAQASFVGITDNNRFARAFAKCRIQGSKVSIIEHGGSIRIMRLFQQRVVPKDFTVISDDDAVFVPKHRKTPENRRAS